MLDTAIAAGVNKFKYFPKNSLQGCCNDADDWADFFRWHEPKKLVLLKDSEVVKARLMREFDVALNRDKVESLAVSISSHGSNTPDRNRDEIDNLDECIICHDTTPQFDNIILDDELYDMFRASKTRIHLFFDFCHSGTSQRVLNLTGQATRKLARPRFLPNPDPTVRGLLKEESKLQALAEENRNIILWAGCRADQVSWDAWFGNRANGAFTHNFMAAFVQASRSSRNEIMRITRKFLKEQGYDQTPQLECGFFSRFSGFRF